MSKNTLKFDENGNSLGERIGGGPKDPVYVAWKEEPYEEHKFSSSAVLMDFLGVGQAVFERMLSTNEKNKDGWQCDELFFYKENSHSYVRKTDRPYHRKPKTLQDSVEIVDKFLKE